MFPRAYSFFPFTHWLHSLFCSQQAQSPPALSLLNQHNIQSQLQLWQHWGSLCPSCFLWMWMNCSLASTRPRRSPAEPGRVGLIPEHTNTPSQPTATAPPVPAAAAQHTRGLCLTPPTAEKTFTRNTRASDCCGCAPRVCSGGWCFLKTSEKNVSAAHFGESR